MILSRRVKRCERIKRDSRRLTSVTLLSADRASQRNGSGSSGAVLWSRLRVPGYPRSRISEWWRQWLSAIRLFRYDRKRKVLERSAETAPTFSVFKRSSAIEFNERSRIARAAANTPIWLSFGCLHGSVRRGDGRDASIRVDLSHR